MNNVVKNSKTSPKKSVTAKQLAKSNLTKRKNPDWDNLDRGYRYLTLDMKLPHDLAVAVMGNVVEESLGDYKAALKNGGGRGLIQWDGKKVPSGRYSLWGSIWASVAKPANVYDSTTDTVKNYWAPWGGLKGDKVRLKFIKAPIKEKAKIYAESYLRPGKPRIADRQLSAMQLDSIYNPRIKNIIVLKDGGMLEFLKNGSGIHIKKENRGKFTDYCGGKVTNECILKGKSSSNPAIRKRATFAANARKWKHQFGGLLGKTLEEVDAINNENRNRAKGLFKGMLSGNILPTALNIGSMLNSAYNGWVEPETTYITGQAPGEGGIKNPSKIVKTVAKVHDKGLNVTKKLHSGVKSDASFLTGDNRFALSGRNRITAAQRERALYMITNHYADTQWNKDLVKLFKNREKAKAKGGDIKKFNKAINATLDDFINSGYFKDGGILKAQLGLGLTLFNDPENPNAVGGDIVNSYIRNQLMIPYLNKLKEDYEKWKLLMKLQSNTLKSSLFNNLLNTGLSIGTDYLKSKLGTTTEKADS